ncbi:MAG: hypothetical protein ACT4R6_01955 [Gemmatimonadaceae bacterium]
MRSAELNSAAASVAIAQLGVTLDDGVHPNSPWGQALVDFSGSPNVLYFNLAVNGNWRIQNVPVLSREGSGVPQTTAILFDLGVRDGTDLTSALVAFDLTSAVLAQMPSSATAMSIGNSEWDITTGTKNGAIAYAPPAPNLIAGQAAGDKVSHSGFPNQQADNNECVPVALSNSLQWMNTKYGLGLAAADISVAAMKVVVGWAATGAGQQWWTKKRTRFKDILTTSTIPRFNISEVYDAVARGCDVELRANDHVVAVTGAQKLADGKYTLDLTHDPDQKDGKKPGAEGTQTVTWDPKKKKFSGAPFIEGHAADLIVVECPKQT